MKLLVTGGTGFLGQHLVPKLVAAGHQVRLLSRSKPLAQGVEWMQGDLKQVESVRAALKGMEGIYHLAGLVSFLPEDGRKMYELHVDCTRQLLKEARELGLKRFVLASTSGTIAVSKEERIGTEADDYPITVVGRWPYYLSKIYEEQLTARYCKDHKIPLVILNPSLLMGPGDDRLSSTWTVMKFLQQDIPSMPNGGLSFVDVRDAAEAFVQALTRGELYGRHLMGVNMPFTEFFGRLERLSGVPAPRMRLPSKVNTWGSLGLERFAKWQGKEPKLDSHSVEIAEHFFYLDSAKAERELGFTARDPHQTLFDTVSDLLKRLPEGSVAGTKGELSKKRSEATR